MQLIFYMQISMKACYKLILRFFDGYGQAFPKFPKKQFWNVFTIFLKNLEINLTFPDANKHQSFLTVDFKTLDMKVFYNVMCTIMKTWRTWWWEGSSILKVVKVTSINKVLRKSIATAFVFYCDAKHSDTLLGSSHVRRNLLLGGCGQKWGWPFRSWNSAICCCISKRVNS